MLLLIPAAWACPTLATGEGSSLSFDVAQVAIAREGTRTTFSVSINPFGDPGEFALVLPVPEVLSKDEVRTLDGEIFAALDGFTAPRHVSDAGCTTYGDDEGGCQGPCIACEQELSFARSDDVSTTSDVEVEASYLVGEYEITILSAEESDALSVWLDDHGYGLPEGADEILAEYIEGGSYFLTAKVAEGALAADGSPLAPLQVAYDSEIFYVPIRLATLNSPGEQDLVVYAITSYEDGVVGIANYPEIEVPEGCVWEGDSFTTFYDDLFTAARADLFTAAWSAEYSGSFDSYACNPCTGTYLDAAQVAELGFTGDFYDALVTRIHMRYTPEQAQEELTLYASGGAGQHELAYADDVEANYTCIATFCDGSATPELEEDEEDESGCAQGGGGPVALLPALALLAIRRRA